MGRMLSGGLILTMWGFFLQIMPNLADEWNTACFDFAEKNNVTRFKMLGAPNSYAFRRCGKHILDLQR